MSLIQIASGGGEYQAGGACDLEEVLWTDAVLSAPAHSLSLTGDPGHDIDSILANQDPQTGRPLRPHRSAIGGYTHVLTAPKCVGVLVGLGIDPRPHHAIHLATQETLRLITLITSVDGTAPDGKTPCGLIAVACLQRLTRGMPKPHPHPHVVVVPLVLLPDGQGYARADLSLLFEHGKLLRGFFQHQLGARTAELGYPVHRVGSSFSIRGFPPQAVTRFSVSVEELSSRRKHDLTRRRDVDYETIQAGWRAELSPETLALLKSLRRGAASPPRSPLASLLSATADRLLANQFSAPVVDVVREALLEMIGQAPVPAETVAGWLLKGLPSDTKCICTGPAGDLDLTRPEWLEAEAAILTRLRLLDGANAGWLSPRVSAEWWAQPLLHDRHRVAVLSGDFPPTSVQQLAESIGVQATVISGPSLAGAATRPIQPKGTMIVSAAEEAPPRLLAEVVLGRLDSGGRVLFLRLPQKRTARSWLRKLELYAGVPVFYPPEAGRLNTILEPVPLPIRLQCESADPIDVVAGWVRRGTPTVLVCEPAEVDRQTTAVRNKLAALGVLRRGGPVARLARTTAPLGPGMVVQSARNHGSIRANERLTIVSVQGDGVTVQRPSGFLAMIPRSAALGFERFTQTRSDLRAAEHIFFTRSGATPEKRRVRAGQWDMVRDVRADGTVTLRSGRTLGPGYGHWHYRYCVAADGPVLPCGSSRGRRLGSPQCGGGRMAERTPARRAGVRRGREPGTASGPGHSPARVPSIFPARRRCGPGGSPGPAKPARAPCAGTAGRDPAAGHAEDEQSRNLGITSKNMKTSNIRVTRLEWKKAKPDDPTVSESIVFDAFPKPAWAFPRDHFISGRVDPPARLELQFRTHTVCLETPQARQLLHDLRSGTVHAVLKAIPGQGAPAAGGNGVATVTEIIVTPHRPTPRPHS